MYQVRSHRDIAEKIIPFFQRYHLQIMSKDKKFRCFAEIGKIVKSKEHLRTKGFKDVKRLVAEMRQ